MKGVPVIVRGVAPPLDYTGFMVSEDFYYIFVIEGRPLACGPKFPKVLLSLSDAKFWYEEAGCFAGPMTIKENLPLLYKYHGKHPVAGPKLMAYILGNGE